MVSLTDYLMSDEPEPEPEDDYNRLMAQIFPLLLKMLAMKEEQEAEEDALDDFFISQDNGGKRSTMSPMGGLM